MPIQANGMDALARWIFCLGMALFGARSVMADEARTACPLIHPEKPDVRLRSGECLPAGQYGWTWAAEEEIDHGDNVRTYIYVYRRDAKYDPLRKAKIECNYKDRTTVHIPVQGALLRCGIKYYLPDLDNLKPGENPDPQIRDVWAISEVENNPKAPK